MFWWVLEEEGGGAWGEGLGHALLGGGGGYQFWAQISEQLSDFVVHLQQCQNCSELNL